MLQEIIGDALAQELTSGDHLHEIISGEMRLPDYCPKDFFIASSYGGQQGLYHTFHPDDANPQKSFARLREALAHVPEGSASGYDEAFLCVLASKQEIVASLVVSENADGSTFILLGYHKEIPKEEAYALIHRGMSTLSTEYGKLS